MNSRFKVFVLSTMAAVSFGALLAQVSSATPLTAEGSQPTTFITVRQDGITETMKTPHGTITCVEALWTSSIAGTSASELTMLPSYPTEKESGGSNCTAFGFAGSHIITTGCSYTLTTPTRLSATEVTFDPAQVHFEPSTCIVSVTVTSFGVSVCTMNIESQTPTGGHVVGKNIADPVSGKMAVTLELTMAGVHYKGSGGVCGENITNTNATIETRKILRCYSNASHTAQVGCTYS